MEINNFNHSKSKALYADRFLTLYSSYKITKQLKFISKAKSNQLLAAERTKLYQCPMLLLLLLIIILVLYSNFWYYTIQIFSPLMSRLLQQFHYVCQSFFCDMVKLFHVGISFIFTFPLMLSYNMSLPPELEHFHDLGSLLHYSCYSYQAAA